MIKLKYIFLYFIIWNFIYLRLFEKLKGKKYKKIITNNKLVINVIIKEGYK